MAKQQIELELIERFQCRNQQEREKRLKQLLHPLAETAADGSQTERKQP